MEDLLTPLISMEVEESPAETESKGKCDYCKCSVSKKVECSNCELVFHVGCGQRRGKIVRGVFLCNNCINSCVKGNGIDPTKNDRDSKDEDSKTEELENASGETSKKPRMKVTEIDLRLKDPSQIPPPLSDEEEKIKERLFSGSPAVQFLKLHCTACNVHLGSALKDRFKRAIHPLLRVIICRTCYNFYTSGEFDKDEDGSELYCRWCGQGGKVMCCARCCYVFCQKCVRQNKGRKTLEIIRDSDDWLCFACNPEQIISHKIICTRLYYYTEKELELANGDPTRMEIDYSVCCQEKKKQVFKEFKSEKPKEKEKRRRSDDYPFNIIDDGDIYAKPAKKPAYDNFIINQITQNHRPGDHWNDQGEEDEVVCTPDLPSLMDDEEPPVKPQDVPGPPPLTPFIRVKVFANEKEMGQQHQQQQQQQYMHQQVRHHPSQILSYQLTSPTIRQLRPVPAEMVPFNSRQHLILPPRPIIANNMQSRMGVRPMVPLNNTPLRFVQFGPQPLKQEWFDKAAQQAATINGKLSTKLVELSQEQRAAITVEQMANVHNKLQELLSTSVNALIQVRKNLRADFLCDLHKMKYPNGPSLPRPTNDAVFVPKNPQFKQSPQLTYPGPSSNMSILQSSLQSSAPRLKVKSVSELATVPSECITIPDDPDPAEEEEAKTNGPVEDAPAPAPNPPSASDKPTDAPPAEVCDDQTQLLIKQALLESKFEYTVAENQKVTIDEEDLSEDDVKKMLSVRVCLETNYSPGTPKTSLKKGFKPMAFTNPPNENKEISESARQVVPMQTDCVNSQSAEESSADSSNNCDENKSESQGNSEENEAATENRTVSPINAGENRGDLLTHDDETRVDSSSCDGNKCDNVDVDTIDSPSKLDENLEDEGCNSNDSGTIEPAQTENGLDGFDALDSSGENCDLNSVVGNKSDEYTSEQITTDSGIEIDGK